MNEHIENWTRKITEKTDEINDSYAKINSEISAITAAVNEIADQIAAAKAGVVAGREKYNAALGRGDQVGMTAALAEIAAANKTPQQLVAKLEDLAKKADAFQPDIQSLRIEAKKVPAAIEDAVTEVQKIRDTQTNFLYAFGVTAGMIKAVNDRARSIQKELDG